MEIKKKNGTVWNGNANTKRKRGGGGGGGADLVFENCTLFVSLSLSLLHSCIFHSLLSGKKTRSGEALPPNGCGEATAVVKPFPPPTETSFPPTAVAWNRYRSSNTSLTDTDDGLSSFQLFVCGLAAGTCAKLVCHPLDVVKKRFQI